MGVGYRGDVAAWSVPEMVVWTDRGASGEGRVSALTPAGER